MDSNGTAARTAALAVRGKGPQAPRILVVDDEEPFARRLARTFEESGFSVSFVCDGASALAFEADHPLDLLVLDYRMPPPDGGEVLRILRGRGAEIPVLLVTGDVTEGPESCGLLYEDCFVLRKPCAYEEIVKSATAILESRGLLHVSTAPAS